MQNVISLHEILDTIPPSSEAIDTITDHITRIFKSTASETLSQKIRNFQGENSTNHGLDRPAKLHVKNITEREIFIILIKINKLKNICIFFSKDNEQIYLQASKS